MDGGAPPKGDAYRVVDAKREISVRSSGSTLGCDRIVSAICCGACGPALDVLYAIQAIGMLELSRRTRCEPVRLACLATQACALL